MIRATMSKAVVTSPSTVVAYFDMLVRSKQKQTKNILTAPPLLYIFLLRSACVRIVAERFAVQLSVLSVNEANAGAKGRILLVTQ